MTTMSRYDFALDNAAIKVEELRLPAHLASPETIQARRAAVTSLDALVRRQLGRVGPGMFAVVQPQTVYDAVYAAMPEIGGHWTVSSTWMGLLTHTISTYSVSLAFDDEQRPDHFVVSGNRDFVTNDVSEASLANALNSARAFGPLQTSAPHVFPGFAL